MKEGGENARVGIDSFAANLLGKIDHMDVIGRESLGATGTEAGDAFKSGGQSV